jgi:hypothetical protein
MNWEDSDIAQFRDYNKKSGGRLIKVLQSRIPICNGKTIETVALEAKYKEGYEKAVKDIEEMLADPDQNIDPSSGKFAEM